MGRQRWPREREQFNIANDELMRLINNGVCSAARQSPHQK
jgi:hypothetical protein